MNLVIFIAIWWKWQQSLPTLWWLDGWPLKKMAACPERWWKMWSFLLVFLLDVLYR